MFVILYTGPGSVLLVRKDISDKSSRLGLDVEAVRTRLEELAQGSPLADLV